jgi:hypothetical protein
MRGYSKETSLVSSMRWLDRGDDEESEKKMVFWIREFK